mmetsp:Transcript_23087/g.45019  ORF Transcript_23087/g.45019 Transcript_23087/m.45019 type:complete len:248 (-) Transcript_23087:307-1050(-)
MALLILSLAASSGAHINPMISFATILTGHTPATRGVLYIFSQMCGSVIGSQIMKDALPESTREWTVSENGQGQLGGCTYGTLTEKQQFLIEFGFSLFVIVCAYGLAFDARQGKIFGPVLAPIFIAAAIAAGIYSSGTLLPSGYSGAGMNPARCFGPAAVMGGDNWRGHWVYWFGPFTAGAVNAVVYLLAPPHHKAMYEESRRAAAEERRNSSMTKILSAAAPASVNTDLKNAVGMSVAASGPATGST